MLGALDTAEKAEALVSGQVSLAPASPNLLVAALLVRAVPCCMGAVSAAPLLPHRNIGQLGLYPSLGSAGAHR